jgi:hypothetical protein
VRIVYGDVLSTITNPEKHAGLWKRVPGDRRRALLFRKPDFMREHMTTRGTPVGHGFGPENLASGEGNYSFSPKPGLRFIALDSVAAEGRTATSATRSSSGCTLGSWPRKLHTSSSSSSRTTRWRR